MGKFSPYSIRDLSPYIVEKPEAASQSFKAGEPVYLNSGKVTVCSANPQDVYGIAMEDASGTTDTMIKVARIPIGSWWVIEASSTPGVANIGVLYGLAVSSNSWTVDFTETSTTTVYTVDKRADDDLVIVEFKPAVLQA